jgi:DHA1 family bicyclomycin/chloramphenicol resistance-like MFS transporter
MSPATRLRRLTIAVPIVLAALSMLGPFSIDTPFPAFQEMGHDFGVGADPMQLVVSVYLLAFAVMSLLHGPLSDAVGRKPVMVAGVLAYALGSVGCALSTSLPVLLVFRVVQGLSAGGGVIVSRTVVRDMFAGPEAQRLMSRVAMIFGLAPAVAPVIGGLILQVGPWPAIFAFLTVVGVLLALAVVVVLPETHPVERRTPLAVRSILAGLAEIGRDSRFHRVAWAGALSFGGQFLYIGGAAIFVVDLLHRGELDFWMFFVPMIAGFVGGSWVSARAAGRVTGRHLVTAGLGFAVVAGVVNLVVSSLPVGATVPYAVIGPMLIALGVATAYPTIQLTMLDMFPARRGAAASMGGFLQLLLNAVLTAVAVPLVAGTVQTLALAALVLAAAGFALWTWHLAVEHRDVPPPEYPELLEPTDQV